MPSRAASLFSFPTVFVNPLEDALIAVSDMQQLGKKTFSTAHDLPSSVPQDGQAAVLPPGYFAEAEKGSFPLPPSLSFLVPGGHFVMSEQPHAIRTILREVCQRFGTNPKVERQPKGNVMTGEQRLRRLSVHRNREAEGLLSTGGVSHRAAADAVRARLEAMDSQDTSRRGETKESILAALAAHGVEVDPKGKTLDELEAILEDHREQQRQEEMRRELEAIVLAREQALAQRQDELRKKREQEEYVKRLNMAEELRSAVAASKLTWTTQQELEREKEERRLMRDEDVQSRKFNAEIRLYGHLAAYRPHFRGMVAAIQDYMEGEQAIEEEKRVTNERGEFRLQKYREGLEERERIANQNLQVVGDVLGYGWDLSDTFEVVTCAQRLVNDTKEILDRRDRAAEKWRAMNARMQGLDNEAAGLRKKIALLDEAMKQNTSDLVSDLKFKASDDPEEAARITAEARQRQDDFRGKRNKSLDALQNLTTQADILRQQMEGLDLNVQRLALRGFSFRRDLSRMRDKLIALMAHRRVERRLAGETRDENFELLQELNDSLDRTRNRISVSSLGTFLLSSFVVTMGLFVVSITDHSPRN